MRHLDTTTKALLMKHAVASGKDPFSADYAQGDTNPMTAPPGSIEANRQQGMAGQEAEAEAQAKQQETELKNQQKAVADAEKQQQKMMQDQQKVQQELMAARAEVDAYKARDAASSPGMSPSFDATQKRMQEKVKNLGNATKQYQGALTMNKVADTYVKMAWWKGHFEQPRYQQITELIKIANSMNPPSVAPQPKTTKGPSAVPSRPSATPTKTPAVPAGGSGGSGGGGAAPATPEIKPLSAFKGDDYATPSHQWRQQFTDANPMNDAQKAQYSEMVNNEMNAARAEGNRGWFDTTRQAVMDTYGTEEGMQDLARHRREFATNPQQYLKDNGNEFLASGSNMQRLNDQYGEGSLGASGWRAGLAKAQDFVTDTVTAPWTTAASGLSRVATGVGDAWGKMQAGSQAKSDYMDEFGLKGNAADRDAAVQAARDAYVAENPSAGGIMSGLGATGVGLLGSAANVVGGGVGGGAMKGGMKALMTPAMAGSIGMGAGYGIGEGMLGTAGSGMAAPNGGPSTPPSPSPSPGGADPSSPAQGGTPLTVENMQGIFAGAGRNPGFAQNINDYSGWANQNLFPGAMAGQYQGNPNSILGQLGNVAMGLFGQPNYNSFQQGQMAFRNSGSPQFGAMNDAMSAFGQRGIGYPMQMPNLQQNRPASLSTYGY